MVALRNGLSASVAALAVVLTLLGMGPGMGPAGWAAGASCGVVVTLAVARLASGMRVRALSPADLVTLARGTLSCAVAALVADSFLHAAAVRTLVALAAVALASDAVDGLVARRTGTASAFGARLDGETDAFLMLVLSVYVARSAGGWVLVIGALRYLFAMAGWLLPWMRTQLPPRFWRKVVTAVAGIALVFSAAEVAGIVATYAALLAATLLLAESFGRDVWWLWRHRGEEIADTPGAVEAARTAARPWRLAS